MTKFEKNKLTLRRWLLGASTVNKSYDVVNRAFDLAETRTVGFRKDGVTPNFNHPIEVTLYLTTLHHGLRNPVFCYAGALLHDVKEDFGVTDAEIAHKLCFLSPDICNIVERLSKNSGIRKVVSLQEYFDEMLEDASSPIIKGADRINNQGTMIGTFSPEKQMEYVEETDRYILPMLKKARKLYPDQESAIQNIKYVLSTQISLVRAIHQKI